MDYKFWNCIDASRMPDIVDSFSLIFALHGVWRVMRDSGAMEPSGSMMTGFVHPPEGKGGCPLVDFKLQQFSIGFVMVEMPANPYT
jgi:hypothetical protein